MNNKKIAIIGCGNLGLSILNGLIESKAVSPNQLIATRRNTNKIDFLKEKGIEVTSNNEEAVKNADIVILALKPYTILEVSKEIQPFIDLEKKTIISLASGILIEQLVSVFGKDADIFRAMPNTAADVAMSLTCISTNSNNQEKNKLTLDLFNSIGDSLIIDENLMDAATVLGACGIAYVLRFMRAMIQGGIEIGFDAKTANQIVKQTVKGAAELLIQRNQHPEFEIDKVTTPKGCTIVGLNEMEHNGFSSALIKGIVTSFEKI